MRIGLTKGLAASAVGALAVTGLTAGLAAGPASAAGPGVVLLSLYNQGNDASVRQDGFGSAIALTAMRLDPAATISFELNTNPAAGDGSPGWTAVPGAPTVTGDYTELAWVPDPALVGKEVAVRAVATVGGAATYSTRQGVAIARAEWGTESISVGRLPGGPANVGFFDQPYASTGRTATHASVPGQTSATNGTVQVGWWNPATQTLQGKVDATVEPSDLKVLAGPAVPGGGSFRADLDITAFDADPGDTIALAGELDTDEVRIVPLAAQTVAGVSASAPQVAVGQPTTVTVRVSDGSAQPIAGAEIRRTSNSSLVGYTDANGKVRDQQVGGSIDGYYVNTTDVDAFEGGTDFSATVATYVPTPQTVFPASLDGRVFDDNEYAAGDLYLYVKNQMSEPMPAGGTVSYRVYPTGSPPPATYETATTDNLGRAPAVFVPQGPDGDYTLDYHLGSNADQTVTFTAGEATFGLAPVNATSTPGGDVTQRATLTVAGTPLSNRRVGATYARGIELVPGLTPDAAMLDGTARVLSLTGSTDPLGALTVAVDDLVENPQGAETGGKLALVTAAAAPGGVSLTGNPAESVNGTTAFGSTKGKVKIKLKGSSAGAKDKLVVKGPDSVTGEKVKFFRMVNGKLKSIKSKQLGKKGDTVLKVTDANGAGITTYVVKLVSSERVQGSKSKKLKLE